MRLLLDTHVAVWSVSDTTLVPSSILDLISAEQNEVFVSAASIWEISVKYLSKKSTRPPFDGHEAIALFRAAGFTLLDISAVHAASVEIYRLDHSDPFDRLIFAQAMAEPMHLVTRDAKLIAASDTVISW